MDVTESLTKARDAVKGAALPDEWQVPAFIEVLRHLMTGGTKAAPNGGGGAIGGGSENGQGTSAGPQQPSETPAGRLAARAKVSEDALLDVFDFTGEGVTLHVANSRIAASKAKATQEIALLITAARQASGLDAGWTSANFARDALQHYNRYDQSNFSSNMSPIDYAFNARGRGTTLEWRLTQPGWEAAIELIRRVAGAAE